MKYYVKSIKYLATLFLDSSVVVSVLHKSLNISQQNIDLKDGRVSRNLAYFYSIFIVNLSEIMFVWDPGWANIFSTVAINVTLFYDPSAEEQVRST